MSVVSDAAGQTHAAGTAWSLTDSAGLWEAETARQASTWRQQARALRSCPLSADRLWVRLASGRAQCSSHGKGGTSSRSARAQGGTPAPFVGSRGRRHARAEPRLLAQGGARSTEAGPCPYTASQRRALPAPAPAPAGRWARPRDPPSVTDSHRPQERGGGSFSFGSGRSDPGEIF